MAETIKDLGLVMAIKADTVAPTNPLMIWYDMATKRHKYYDYVAGSWLSLSTGAHSALADLSWALSGHIGTPDKLAGFDADGDAMLYDLPTKSSVGLGNVDDTSDVNKPVSTAQQLAIDAVASQVPKTPLVLKGDWDAITNTPALSDTGAFVAGDAYECTVADEAGTVVNFGSVDYTFHIGDFAIYGANSKWYLSLNKDAVTSVNGKKGAVVLVKGDLSLGNVDNTADTDKPVSTAQATAIDSSSSVVYLIDSEKGVSSGATGGKLKPFNSIDSFLAKVDDNTIKRFYSESVDFSGGGNTINVADGTKYKTGQIITGDGVDYNTRVLAVIYSTVILDKNLLASKTNTVIKSWYDVVAVCTGTFRLSNHINRLGVRFKTMTGAVILAPSADKLIHYTDSDYVLPCRTIEGNWSISVTDSGQLIKYDFTTDIGVTDAPYNFFDEWDTFSSAIVLNTESGSSIAMNNISENNVKVGLKYRGSYSGGLFFWNNYAKGISLSVTADRTEGELGCFQGHKSGGLHDFKNLHISEGELVSPVGIQAIDFQTGDSGVSYDVRCDVKGSMTLTGGKVKFFGNVTSSTEASFSGNSDDSSENVATVYGNIKADLIVYQNCNVYGFSNGLVRLGGSGNKIYGSHTGKFEDMSTAVSVICGDDKTLTTSISLTNGGKIIAKGFLANSDNLAPLGAVSNGELVLMGNGHVYGGSFALSGTGKITIADGCDFTGGTLVTQSGGTLAIVGGKVTVPTLTPAFAVSGGKRVVRGGLIVVPDNVTNPIKITADNATARDIYLTYLENTCDGISNSFLFAFDSSGNTYAPNMKVAGYKLIEEPNLV